MISEAALSAGVVKDSPTRTWQVWGILKQEILYLCWALMEIALLTPLALFIMRWTRLWPAGQIALWLLLIMMLPFNMVRFLSALQVKRKHQRRIVFGSLIVTLFVTWRVVLFNSRSLLDLGWLTDLYSNVGESGSVLWARILILFLLLLLVWWRGLRLVNFRADIQQGGYRLRAGVLLFIPVALLPDLRTSAWGVMPFVLLFVLAGLTAISLIRAEQVEGERSGYAASLSPRWVGTIFLTSLLVVLIAGLFAAIVSGDMVVMISAWLSPVRMAVVVGTTVVLATVFFLASPLFFLFYLLFNWLSQIFSSIFAKISERLGFTLPANLEGLDSFLPIPDEMVEVTGLTMPDSLTRALTLLVMLFVMILVSLTLTRRFRNVIFAPRMGPPIRELRGDAVSTPTIGQRVLQRLGLLGRWRMAASIRNIYKQMSYAAASVGYARSETETPYEYLENLAKVWPDSRPESLLITEAFIRIRYGEIPETKAELEAIKQAWKKLEQSIPAK